MVPSGGVKVTVDGVVREDDLVLSEVDGRGVGSFELAGLAVGSHDLMFAYKGDGNTNGSATPDPVTVKVVRASTSMSLVPEESEAIVGGSELVTVRATVLDGAEEPRSGDVVFTGLGESKTVALNAQGVAEWMLPADVVGEYTIEADFAGDGSIASAHKTVSYEVVQAASAVKVTVPAKATVADVAKVSVSATGSSLVPSGDVHVSGSGVDETFTLDEKGEGELKLADLGVGSYVLTFEYLGDEDEQIKGSSKEVSFEVVSLESSTSLVLTGGTGEPGESKAVVGGSDLVTATATVVDADSQPVAGAEVVFTGVGESHSVTLGEDGKASWTLPATKVDEYTLRATFGGVGDLAGSDADADYEVVKAATKVDVDVPAEATAADVVPVSVSATNSSVVPSGDVVVTGEGFDEQTVKLDKDTGIGELKLAGLAAGTYELMFAYKGDGNTNGSATPDPVTVKVVRASTSMSLVPEESEAIVGGSELVTVRATVLDGAEEPRSGDVVFTGLGESKTVALNAQGVAEWMLPADVVGEYTIEADFAGDGSIASAHKTVSYEVVQAASAVKVTVPAKATVADVAKVSVSATGSSLVPSGDVHVSGSGVDETFTLDEKGEGELKLADLGVGSYVLTFEYLGDEDEQIKGSSKEVSFEVVSLESSTSLVLTGGTGEPGESKAVVGGSDLVTATATVVDADSQPVAGAEVVFTGVGESHSVTLGEDGKASWTLPATKVDEYTLRATFGGVGDLAGSDADADYEVVKAATKVDVDVPAEATAADVVPVSVSATNSSVVPSGDVVVTGEGFDEQTVKLDKDTGIGELKLAGLAAGTYELSFHYVGDDNTEVTDTTATVKVVSGGSGEPVVTDMSLVVAPGRVVFGDSQVPVASATVTDADGAPVEGDVVFTVGEGEPESVKLNDLGVAELDMPTDVVDEITVSAVFDAEGYVRSDASTSYQVVRADTSTSVAVPGAPGDLVGTDQALSVTVGATNSSVVPAGPVQVTGEGVNETVVLDQVIDGKAVGELKLAGLEPGEHELTFAYEGDDHTNDSAAGPVTVIVKQTAGSGETDTNLTVTPENEAPYLGGQVLATASVTVPVGEVAGGWVAFKVGDWFKLAPVEGGVATLRLDADKLGPVEVTAYYMGTKTLNASTSDPASYTVVKADTETTVEGPQGPLAVGAEVPVSVVSTNSAVVPTGRVQVSGAGAEDTWVDLTKADGGDGNGHGKAAGTFVVPQLEPGEYTLTFAYEGDDYTVASASDPITVVVASTGGIRKSDTMLTVTPQSVQVGAPKVRATATVTGPDGQIAAGLVAIQYGEWYKLVELAGGSAGIDLDTDVIGSVAVKAYYLGGGNLKSSASEVVRYDVTKVLTTIVVDGASEDLLPGATLPVVVSGDSPIVPSGRVTVREGTKELSTLELVGGKATLSLAGLTNGNHRLVLSYEGDRYADVSSLEVPLVIKPLETTTSLVLDRATTTAKGAAVTATAAVKVARDAVPGGSFEFEVDGSVVATQPASKAPVMVALPIDRVGAHKVLVRYVGGVTEAGSVSPSLAYAVTKAEATVAAKFKKMKQHRVKVTATVVSPMPVTGTVQVLAAKGKKGKLKVVGKAVVKKAGTTVKLIFTTKPLAKGKRPLTVRYLGSATVLSVSRAYTVRVR